MVTLLLSRRMSVSILFILDRFCLDPFFLNLVNRIVYSLNFVWSFPHEWLDWNMYFSAYFKPDSV